MNTRTLHDGVEFPLIMANPLSGAQPTDVRAWGSWQVAKDFDVHHYTRGQFVVRVDSAPPALDADGNPVLIFGAEIRVSLNAGGMPTIIAGSFLNSTTPPLIVPLAETMAARSLVVEARQIVNGVPDGRTQSSLLQVGATGRVYR